MAVRSLESLKSMIIVTKDAQIMGELVDFRYEPVTWDILGLKVKTNKSSSKSMSAGYGKSMIFLKTGPYAINDVILLPDTLEGTKDIVSADSDVLSALSYLVGKKIVTLDNLTIGTIEDIVIDLDKWSAQSFRVKLDKTAYEPLGIKKGLLSKMISGILTSFVKSVTENVQLNKSMDDLKNEVIVD